MAETNDIQLLDPRLIRQFTLVFLSTSALLVSLMYWFYWQQSKSHMDGVLVQEELVVDLQSRTALDSLQMAVSDLAYLRLQNELAGFLNAEDGALQHLTKEYRALSSTRKLYDQIRLLDIEGQELVRVNYQRGQSYSVSSNQLQNKGSRYYVTNTLNLQNGGVFVSPLDLNIENGQLEQPLKPVIRLGTPVFDHNDVPQGLVVLNYLAENLLNQIRQIGATALGDAMLLNHQSYWILGPQAEDEWGFMFKEKNGTTFRARFPREWEMIEQQYSGQLLTDRGLFTFSTLYPLNKVSENWDINISGNDISSAIEEMVGPYSWKLLSYVSPQVLGQYSASLLTRLTSFGSFLLLLMAGGSYLVAATMARRRIHQSQLKSLAHFDPLTGLPNRTLYFDRLNQAQRQADRYSRPLGQLYVDVDNFKDINDTLGHHAGDQLLTLITKRIVGTVRRSDTVARLGGDEFVVLLMFVNGRACCDVAANKIMVAMQKPFSFHGVSRHITVSIGITLYPEDGNTADEMLKNADIAMYKAKENGKNHFQFYTREMNERALAKMTIENNLRGALSRGELSLHYQPKVDLHTNMITGAEALIRWYQPETGWISPVNFIPVAEQSRLILTIGEWIIEQTCRDLQMLNQKGFQNIAIAVNVSSSQIHQQDVYGIIAKNLKEFSLLANQLEIEITETALLQDNNTSKTVLNQLNASGIKIWLDDFGTGYSSLSHLRKFSVSGVKIDRSFIDDIDTNENDERLVSAIIGLAESLGIPAIAEGIETEEQMAKLTAFNCQFGQGYLFSRPVPFQEFTELLESRV